MKSWFLENVENRAAAEFALRSELPGQEHPWVLRGINGDPIAYLEVAEMLDGVPNVHIVADVSGRYTEGASTIVVSLLRKLQSSVGGAIEDDA